MMHDFLLL